MDSMKLKELVNPNEMDSMKLKELVDLIQRWTSIFKWMWGKYLLEKNLYFLTKVFRRFLKNVPKDLLYCKKIY
jgi:hypothetical protein